MVTPSADTAMSYAHTDNIRSPPPGIGRGAHAAGISGEMATVSMRSQSRSNHVNTAPGSEEEQGAACSRPPCLTRSGARARADHKSLKGVFRDLPPQVLIVAECQLRFPDLLEISVGRRRLGVDLVGGLEGSLQDFLAERP